MRKLITVTCNEEIDKNEMNGKRYRCFKPEKSNSICRVTKMIPLILLEFRYQGVSMHQKNCVTRFAMRWNHAEHLILSRFIELENIFASCLKTGIVLKLHINVQVDKNVILSIFIKFSRSQKRSQKVTTKGQFMFMFAIFFTILLTDLVIN